VTNQREFKTDPVFGPYDIAKDGGKKSVTQIRVQRIVRLDRTLKSEEVAA
jgi:hypothetical protein